MKSSRAQVIRTAAAALALASLFISLSPRIPGAPAAGAKRSPVSTPAPTKSDSTRMKISEAYGKLPMSFEPNRGQTDKRVKFLSRGAGYALYLASNEATLALYKKESEADSISPKYHSRLSSVVHMKLRGANPQPKIEGLESLQGKSNYLVGNDRARWHTDIPTFAQVKYTGVYPGIDVVYYGRQRQLEYDFRLAPGADPGKIRIAFEGAENLSLDTEGNLVLKTSGGEIIQHAPVIYQENESGRQSIAGCYVLSGEHEVGFEVSAYDRSQPLVIDPQLVYATFYGGSAGDSGADIAVDTSGNAYITGLTLSTDLTIKSAFAGSLSGGADVYVVKLNPSGSDIVYATYLGSSSAGEESKGIAVTSDGKACLTGFINTNGVVFGEFPTTPNRFQGPPTSLNVRDVDSFLTVLTPSGNDLFYSTFFGGRNIDDATGIAVDGANKIYITGETESGNFPTKNAFQNSRGGSAFDAFVAKFDPTQSGGNSLIYSSYLGGSGSEIGNDIAVTPAGVAFFVGVTGSFNFPTKSSSSLPPFQTTQGGVNDSFIAKVSPSGALIYSTLFGGNNRDEAQSVAVDSDERAYVTGFTFSSAATFPLKNAFQPNRIGSTSDGFVAKFNADGTALFYSSFLAGGNLNNEGLGIAIDAGGNAYVTGATSLVFSSVNGFPSSVPSGTSFVAKIEASDATGTTIPKILYMDSFGGNTSRANAIAVDKRGNVYIAGNTGSGFTTTPGAFQETFNGGSGVGDAFVVKIGPTFPDTIGVFRPSTGQFLLRNSNSTANPDIAFIFGQNGDLPVAGDWNGDGIDDVGVFRNGQFLLRQPTFQPVSHCVGCIPIPTLVVTTITVNFGIPGDLPVVGDWNGDGIDTVGVFRNGTWALTNAPNINNSSPLADLTFGFGQAGDKPLAGDWNGDGVDTIGVASSNVFALRNSNSAGTADASFTFGDPADLAVSGDWNGDGIDTAGLLRNGTVFLSNSNTTPIADVTFGFGQAGDLPVAGDWDGKPADTTPNSGVNDPNDGTSKVGQAQVFTTTCSDPDGWHDIHTIDFKIKAKDGNEDKDKEKDKNRDEDGDDDNGALPILWVQFDENTDLIRFYDPDLKAWREGFAGANLVLESRFAQLRLAGTSIQGSGPTGTSVNITWEVVFKTEAVGHNYRQFLRITDDAGFSTGFDRVGSWNVVKK